MVLVGEIRFSQVAKWVSDNGCPEIVSVLYDNWGEVSFSNDVARKPVNDSAHVF